MAGGSLTLTAKQTKPTRTNHKMSKYKTYTSKYKKSYKKNYNNFKTAFNKNYPFPPVKLYHLRYNADLTLSSPVASGQFGTEHVFRLNSLFDPDKTGTGHQPYGFDALAVAYNRYKVVGATVEIMVNDPQEDGMALGVMFTNPSNYSTNTLNAEYMDAIGEKQQTFIIRVNDSGNQKVYRRFNLSMARLAGITKLQFKADPDNYTAPVTSNCGNEIAMRLACGSYRSTTSPNMLVHVRITYHALMFQRKIMSTS